MKVKKMIVKIMSAGLLIFIVPLTATITMAQSAAPLISTSTSAGFSDVSSSDPNYTAIMYLQNHGVISGYPDGTFKPDQPVNRAEAVKIIILGTGLQVPSTVDLEPFRDTDRTAWYAPYLEKAKELNVVSGYSDGTFKPDQTVNLVENLKILLLTENIDVTNINVTQDPYADTPKDQWYAPYIEYAKEKNLIDADSNNMVYPDQGMSRGSLAETIYRLMYIKAMNLQQFGSGMTQEQTQEQMTEQETQEQTTQQQTQEFTQQTQESTQQQTVNVSISNMEFSPADITVPSGSTVIWTNEDLMTHSVASDDGTTFNSGDLGNGQTYSTVLTKPGTYTYHCAIHPFMSGTVTVTQ